jgi:uracil-DNA glycosylase family 4
MVKLSDRKVPGAGPPLTNIMIIGEAPGREENIKQEPFVGTAGQILNSMLNQVGLIRNNCWVTNVVKHQPDGNKIDALFVDSKNTIAGPEMEEYLEELKREIEDVDPNVIIALGRTALWALTGETTIQKFRGSILPCKLVPGYKVIATIHPAAIARQWSPWRQVVPVDLQKAHEESEFKEMRLPKREYIIEPSFQEAINELKRLEKVEYLSFDIETRPHKIVTIGFSDDPSRAICIPFTRGYQNYWTDVEEKEIWRGIHRVLVADSKKVAQNAQYDILYLARFHGILVENLWMDTMVAHHEIYPETPKSLQFLASIYTKETFYKDEGKSHGGRVKDESLWVYNCKDAAVTLEIAHVLDKELEEAGLWDQYWETMSYHKPLMTMTLQGVNFDRAAQTTLIRDAEEKIRKFQISLDKAVGQPINVNSNKQMVQLLYVTLGLPIITGKTKKPTADMDALLNLRRRNPKFKPILDIIIALRKLLKLKSGFLEMEVDPYDKRIRCNYNVAGTETWRLSSSGSIFGGGTNLQTIPKRADEEGSIRKLFIPDDGFLMGAVDLSQAEARVVAWLSDDERAIKEFNEGLVDVHTSFASRLFGISYEDLLLLEMSSDPEQRKAFKHKRNLGKMVRHATNYGMSWVGLQRNCQLNGVYIEAREAKKLLADAMKATPMLGLYHRNVREQLGANRTLTTALGKKRQFGGRLIGSDAQSTYREGYAFGPQCLVGHLANRGIARIYHQLGNEIDLLLQVHDEIVFQYPKDRIELAHKARKLMEETVTIRGREMLIPAELKTGDSWGNLKEVKGGN